MWSYSLLRMLYRVCSKRKMAGPRQQPWTCSHPIYLLFILKLFNVHLRYGDWNLEHWHRVHALLGIKLEEKWLGLGIMIDKAFHKWRILLSLVALFRGPLSRKWQTVAIGCVKIYPSSLSHQDHTDINCYWHLDQCRSLVMHVERCKSVSSQVIN